jgi:hypothetical protein
VVEVPVEEVAMEEEGMVEEEVAMEEEGMVEAKAAVEGPPIKPLPAKLAANTC